MVTPQELQNTGFTKGFKGYSCQEVDSYVEYVVKQYGELYRENAELEKKVRILSAKLEEAKRDQDSVSASLLNAQKMADEIIRNANEEANTINSTVRASFDELVESYRQEIETQEKRLYQARKSAAAFKAALLEGYKDQVQRLYDLIPFDSVEETTAENVEKAVSAAIDEAAKKISGADEEPAQA